MPYSYGIRNKYRPTALAPKAYAWSSGPQYNRADVPSGLLGSDPTVPDETTVLQQFAYEWFQSAQLGGDFNLSNPPFVSGASGRLMPSIRSADGSPARILRGYIRRAESEVGDNLSRARLFFMYNPETITRDYVSYLNQAALDPFNTVYQSENLVAPPSILDFSFTLFFDRQEEAGQPDHPGVFVDYQFFDLVVRNVVPTDPNQSNNTIPDNGVMMINPRDITVVFSPQITVQGRPLNAQVSFEKFTHRMVPTRMSIQLTMRAVYIGPVKDMVEYKKEQLQAEAAISIEDPIEGGEATSWLNNNDTVNKWFETFLTTVDPFGVGEDISNLLNLSDDPTGLLVNNASGANQIVREKALDWAIANVTDQTKYYHEGGTGRYNLPYSADCSGLVTEAYVQTGAAQAMGWAGHPATGLMRSHAASNPKLQEYHPLNSIDWRKDLSRGDLLIRGPIGEKTAGHVKFFVEYQGPLEHRNLVVFDAAGPKSVPQVGRHTSGPGLDENYYLLRPTPIGADSSLGQSPTYLNHNSGLYGVY